MTTLRPRPAVDPDSRSFWAGTATGQLIYQRCTACGRAQFYPRALCRHCLGPVISATASGVGSVYSATTVHRAPASFAADAPYVVALVDMDEGFRIMGRLRSGASEVIGQRVVMTFEVVGDIALPCFRLVGTSQQPKSVSEEGSI